MKGKIFLIGFIGGIILTYFFGVIIVSLLFWDFRWLLDPISLRFSIGGGLVFGIASQLASWGGDLGSKA